ncbi:RND superfamily putative drug exporter [Kitasatospora sp. GAS204A]|uniref:MMPL family transporter n=1 Tax=unclassified Kitasatospora TaxID=2633591 RepID=UPI0024761BDE|nr:MMPL family transporter [Kitasatospora sp. GAS204B]MDH6121357.1 RND superfamily putative drug exporter [Kitasatospora sp. GAS204B]
MSIYLFRLAQWAFRRRRLVLSSWLLVAVVTITVSVASGGKTNDNFTIPGTESQQAADLLKAKLPALAGGQTQVVFATHGAVKVTDPVPRAGIEAAVANLAKVPQVASVSNPFVAKATSPNGQVALGQVQYTAQPADVKDATLNAVQAAVTPARDAGVQVEYSGSVYPGWRLVPSELPELIGLVVAFIILLITFGAFVAAGLPILTAVIGVAITLTGVTAIASVVTIASASTTVALMLGLSCGIDYGLFILSRHRNHLLQGREVEQSVSLAAGTAGSSVVFAGLTVIIALCGLSVVGIPFLTIMGLAAAAAVAIALLISLTLLPAMLGFAGEKVTNFISSPLRRGHHEEVAMTAATAPQKTFGAAWARFVVRYRIPTLIGGVALLLLCAVPALDVQLGLPSGSSKPTSDTSRRAYDLTTAAFGPGFNGPLQVVADGVTTPQAVAAMAATLSKVPGVTAVTQLALTNGVGVIRVVPTTGPSDPATADLVHALRDNRAAIEGSSGAKVLIGGVTASNIDVSAKLSAALPVFLAVVVGLAFLLLTFAFRTILVPIKSIIGFLLSVSAAFGLTVALFQWGWGQSVFGITKAETISFLPIIMLAIIFGLSSDYEVFVVSRIKEDFTKTGDARGAVQRGTGLSARVVTAAALIMFFIFVAFMFSKDPTIKAIGFSFAAGVFLDAFVVRLTLVPAVLAIVRAKVWYHPQWFSKYVPNPDIEGEKLEEQLARDREAVSEDVGR